MATMIDWAGPPLTPEDQRLVEAYRTAGRSLDDLPYTPEFDAIVAKLGYENTEVNKHALFKRLLDLRKRGRLPRTTASV